MKNILNFKNFVNENIEFPAPGAAPNGFTGLEPKDPQLSMNGYDKFKADQLSQYARLNQILKSVYSTDLYTVLGKSEFDFDIKDFKIFRIFRNNNGYLDIYIKFKLNENNYMGCFKDWTSRNCKFESSVLLIPEIRLHLENKIKIEGLFKKVLNEWFIPKIGEYITLKDVKVYNDMGEIFHIPTNSLVKVDEVITEDEQPVLIILFNGKKYYLTNLDFYFFHWWFDEKKSTKYYV